MVYRYVKPEPPQIPSQVRIDHKIVDQQDVERFFRSDSDLFKTFRGFLTKGYIGAVGFQGNEWMTHGWLATPATEQPIHLPHWVRYFDAHWIFYCHTKEKYRGQGLYKLILQFLLQTVFERTKGEPARIHIDCLRDNIPSRRAILSVGFEPNGVLTTYQLIIPRVKRFTWGNWDRRQDHLPM